MMKPKDCATATALLIQGYLRANADEQGENNALRDALAAIVSECSDWGENVGVRFKQGNV